MVSRTAAQADRRRADYRHPQRQILEHNMRKMRYNLDAKYAAAGKRHLQHRRRGVRAGRT
jgi:hypothetical protein